MSGNFHGSQPGEAGKGPEREGGGGRARDAAPLGIPSPRNVPSGGTEAHRLRPSSQVGHDVQIPILAGHAVSSDQDQPFNPFAEAPARQQVHGSLLRPSFDAISSPCYRLGLPSTNQRQF